MDKQSLQSYHKSNFTLGSAETTGTKCSISEKNMANEKIKPILDEIISLTQNQPAFAVEQQKIESFLISVVNGDDYIGHVAFLAKLSENQDGLLAFVLTNQKLIKIEVGAKELKSVSTYLKEIASVDRTLLTTEVGNNAITRVIFPQGSFGIRYSDKNKKIDEFFQSVDASVKACSKD